MNNKETEVRIADMLAMLLKAFKMILCLVFILGFLGALYGAYSYIKTHPRVTEADVEAAERSVTTAEVNLAKAQSALSYRNTVTIPGIRQKIDRIGQMVLQMQEYMKNSTYYNMNPFHRGASRLRFIVEMNQDVALQTNSQAEDCRAGIVIGYTQMCPFDLETLQQVKNILDVETESQYIQELISVTNDEDRQVVEICMLYDDLDIAEQVVDLLYRIMCAKAEESLPKHQTTVLTRFTGYEVDQDMSKNHAINEKRLNTAEDNLKDANTSLENLISKGVGTEEQSVAEATNALKSAQSSLRTAQYYHAKNRPSLRNLAKRTIKYGVLSGMVGLFLGCCIALSKGLFGGIIQNQNQVMNRYSFPLIGILPNTKKVWFGRTIRKLEGEPTDNFEATLQATVQSLLSRIGEKNVCLVSTGSNDIAQKVGAYTDDKVPVIGNIIDSADTVKELGNYEAIILVEERGKSRIDLVDAEVLRAKALNKEIIGIVLA